jgi:predicted permease
VFAVWSSRALVAHLSNAIRPVVLPVTLDWRVLAFTAAVTIATTVFFGTAPALRAMRVAPLDALKEQGRNRGEAAGQVTLSSGLVVAQVALSLVLVVAAGLFGRTFERLASVPLGFDRDRVLVVTVDATRAHVEPAGRLLFYQRLTDAVAAVPGVARAAGSQMTPVNFGLMLMSIVDVPEGPPLSERERTVPTNVITSGWFATYGSVVRTGRDFDARDTKGSLPVVLVNEAFVRKFFPDGNAIGRTVRPGYVTPDQGLKGRTIVGVVGDQIFMWLRDGAPPTMYQPLAQWDVPSPPAGLSISIRSAAGSPMLLARSVASALTAADRDLAFSIRPLAEQVNASLAQERLLAWLAAFFGALALLLAGLGLYGVTSYMVTRRRMEIGIRMALGAAPRGVIGLVLARVSVLVTLGIVGGGVMSLWASRFVASLLYGLEARDLGTLAGSAAVLTIVAAFAGWLPARRASRIDPAEVLREG